MSAGAPALLAPRGPSLVELLPRRAYAWVSALQEEGAAAAAADTTTTTTMMMSSSRWHPSNSNAAKTEAQVEVEGCFLLEGDGGVRDQEAA